MGQLREKEGAKVSELVRQTHGRDLLLSVLRACPSRDHELHRVGRERSLHHLGADAGAEQIAGTKWRKLLGIPAEKVEVHVTLIGGGFGRRLAIDYALEAAEISRAVKAPVQGLWTRADDMQHGHFQAASAHRLTAAIDDKGNLVQWTHTKAGSPHNIDKPERPDVVRDAAYYQDLSWGVYDIPYVIPSIETAYVSVEIPVRHGPWRSVFAPSSVFARESLSTKSRLLPAMDPLAYRLKLLEGPDMVKTGSLNIDRRRLRKVLGVVREKSGWGERLPERSGRGIACNVYDGETHIAYVAEVSVNEVGDVRVKRVTAAIDCGLIVNPNGVEQQMESGILWGMSSALGSDITFRNGRVEQNSFTDYAVVRMRDTPEIAVHLVPGDKPQPCTVSVNRPCRQSFPRSPMRSMPPSVRECEVCPFEPNSCASPA